MTIVDFLLARLAEDEAAAALTPQGSWAVATGSDDWHSPATHVVEAPPPPPGVPRDDQGEANDPVWVVDTEDEAIARHVARHSHTRVLDDCLAKRALVEYYAAARAVATEADDLLKSATHAAVAEALLFSLRVLATVYDDHLDWREEWRP